MLADRLILLAMTVDDIHSLNSISAHMVIANGEYYRIVSAAFVHAGIMHIGMNMMSLYQLGYSLEQQVLTI